MAKEISRRIKLLSYGFVMLVAGAVSGWLANPSTPKSGLTGAPEASADVIPPYSQPYYQPYYQGYYEGYYQPYYQGDYPGPDPAPGPCPAGPCCDGPGPGPAMTKHEAEHLVSCVHPLE